MWQGSEYASGCNYGRVNTLSANPTKWSNTLKQFVGNLPKNCLSVFDHFVKLALKGLRIFQDIECARFLHMQALHKVLNMTELTDALINCSGYRRVLNMPDQSFKVLNMPLVVNARARNMTRLWICKGYKGCWTFLNKPE